MKDYNSPIYDAQREIIELYREKGESWERILFGRGETEDNLEVFLKEMALLNFWEISAEDWKCLVNLETIFLMKLKNIFVVLFVMGNLMMLKDFLG